MKVSLGRRQKGGLFRPCKDRFVGHHLEFGRELSELRGREFVPDAPGGDRAHVNRRGFLDGVDQPERRIEVPANSDNPVELPDRRPPPGNCPPQPVVPFKTAPGDGPLGTNSSGWRKTGLAISAVFRHPRFAVARSAVSGI